MNLIEELKNYCDINNPVGALMLSGYNEKDIYIDNENINIVHLVWK